MEEKQAHEASLSAFCLESSTTKVADACYPRDKEHEDIAYNPFEHRKTKTVSDAGATMHLLKGSLGTGILAMPNAFRNGGLMFGLAATLLVGLVCTYCVHMLVAVSRLLCRRTRTPALDYAQTAEAAFRSGPAALRAWAAAARTFLNACLVVTYYSTGVVYVVFIATSLKQVGDHHSTSDLTRLDVRLYMLLLLPPLAALGLVRDLRYLTPFSAASNLLIGLSFCITLSYIFRDLPPAAERSDLASAHQLPLFFSTVIFALEGIGVVMPVENSMKNPQRFLGCPGILNFSMAIIVALYAVIGFFGYVKYGEDTLGSVTLNLPTEDVLAQVVKICIALAVFFTYGLQMFVPTAIVWSWLRGHVAEARQSADESAYRIAVTVVTVAVAAAVPNLSPIISLVGAVCFSTLGLLCPAVIDSVARWQQASALRHLKNAAIGAFSLLALCAGAYTSLLEISKAYGG